MIQPVRSNARSFTVTLLLWLISLLPSHGQDVSGLSKKNLIKVSGNLNASTTFYHAVGIENRRLPFFWMLQGNLNVQVAGIDIPISAAISTQSKEFAVPVNQFGLSSKCKFVTAHLGYRSLRYSRFSLSGTTFLGAGIDVKPPKSPVHVSAMYGRFEKASLEGSSLGVNFGQPTYQRMGFSTKVTVGNKDRHVDLVVFRAKDDVTSIALPDSLGVAPEENLVLAVATKSKLTKMTSVELEYALSAYTQDTRDEDLVLDSYTYFNNLGGLFTPNATTEFQRALLANVHVKAKRADLKFSYRRVDPGYRTMGSVFLNNDLEDVTAGAAFQLFNYKLQWAVNGGLQRNNLNEEKISGTLRLIGSTNLSYTPNERLGIQLDFSNYNTRTETAPVFNLDSLDFYQVTRNVGAGASYALGGVLFKHSVFAQANLQDVVNSAGTNSTNLNINVGHQMTVGETGLSVATTYNINRFRSEEFNNLASGPGMVVTKTTWKNKLRSSLSTTYLSSQADELKTTQNVSVRLTNQLRIGERQNLGMNLSTVNRRSFTPNGKNFTEYRATLNYGYTF